MRSAILEPGQKNALKGVFTKQPNRSTGVEGITTPQGMRTTKNLEPVEIRSSQKVTPGDLEAGKGNNRVAPSNFAGLPPPDTQVDVRVTPGANGEVLTEYEQLISDPNYVSSGAKVVPKQSSI